MKKQKNLFPSLPFSLYRFDPSLVRSKISSSICRALDQPLNYVRIYLAPVSGKKTLAEFCSSVGVRWSVLAGGEVVGMWLSQYGEGELGSPEVEGGRRRCLMSLAADQDV